MDISTVGTSGLVSGLESRRVSSTGVFKGTSVSDAQDRAVPEKRGAFKANPRGLALGILKQELRAAQSVRLGVEKPVVAYPDAGPSVAGIVGDVLASVEKLLSQFPFRGTEITEAARASTEAATNIARDIVDSEELDEVDDVLESVSDGLDELETDAARNVPSQAYVLSAESKLKERSTIRIRTQDGDVVVLKLKRNESFSYAAAGTENASIEQFEANQKTRMSFSVRGELDDGELAAIRSVFEQAEDIAAEFFDGDVAKAFESASALSFDSSELARVRLKFRQVETSRIEAAVAFSRPLVASQPSPALESPVAVNASPVETPDDVPAVAPQVAEVDEVVPEQAVVEEAPAAIDEAPVNDFLQQLSDFLRDTLKGFENVDGQRYFFTESFKFSLLKSALTVAAPDDGEVAANRANAVIDAVSEDNREAI